MVWFDDRGRMKLCETGIDGFLIVPAIWPKQASICSRGEMEHSSVTTCSGYLIK